MATKFMVNGQERSLEMLVNGIDASRDFVIGNSAYGMAIDDEGRYIATEEEFDWWRDTIDGHLEMAAIIDLYKEMNDPDEVDRVVNDWIGVDLDDQPAQVRTGLIQAFGPLE